jgi:hypothetical protein
MNAVANWFGIFFCLCSILIPVKQAGLKRRMEEMRSAFASLVAKPQGKISLGEIT